MRTKKRAVSLALTSFQVDPKIYPPLTAKVWEEIASFVKDKLYFPSIFG